MTQLYSYSLFGNKVECNCCGRKYKYFLPKGNGISLRENALCPWCFSLERTRLLLFYLVNETNILKDKQTKILHFAPEPTLFNQFKKHSNYTDADIDANYARNVVDIQSISFEDNYFDYIICSHVLGHVEDENKALSELFRVLKNGSTSLILTLLGGQKGTIEANEDLTDQQRLKLYGEKDLRRLHGFDLKERIEAVGFDVKIEDYRANFNQYELERYQLGDGKREMIFVCTKPNEN